MGMFIKTLVAGIIAALLAGSVVYYGMPASNAPATINLRGNTQNTASQERWIDRFLKPVDRAVRPKPAAVNRPRAVDPRSVSPAPDTEAIRYYRLENGEFTEIDAPPARAFIQDSINPDASMRILSVMEQAALIRQSDLRDRAYLDVVDFALSESLFVPASSALEKIKQVELRDTARSRIAVSLAQRGDSTSAFALIDEVEVNELRDVMRLQVIEALIAPQPEPEPEPSKKRR